MKITLSPTRSDLGFNLEKQGDILIINGETFDFTDIPDGGLLPNEAIISDCIISDVERIDGTINLTLLFPNDRNATEAQRFPDPLNITEDGEVILP